MSYLNVRNLMHCHDAESSGRPECAVANNYFVVSREAHSLLSDDIQQVAQEL